MKTQKIIFSAVLVFAAGILLFAKSTKANKNEEKAVMAEAVENIEAVSTLNVVWHDAKGLQKEADHKALSNMPYAEMDEYYYDFENKKVVKKLYATINIKKVWNFQENVK